MPSASAMTIAVSALKAQQQALSGVSNNLANSSTVGYKANDTRFISLVTTPYTDNAVGSGGGVRAVTRQNVLAQGATTSTSNSTDMAINGNGMFCVTRKSNGTDNPTELSYTRDGEFSVDSNGYLSFGQEYYLEGYSYSYDSATGTTTPSSNLAAIQVNDGSQRWKPTASVALDANLPMSMSDAAVSSGTASTVNTTTTVYDSSGASHTVTMAFSTDTGTADQWTVSLSSSDSTLTFSPSSYDVSFNGSTGAIASVAPTGSTAISGFAPSVTITIGNSTPAQTQSVSFDFADLSQYNSGSDFSLTSINQDGYPPSGYSGVAIDTDGTITAKYSSGLKMVVGKVVLANFTNANGLEVLSNGLYQESTNSGQAMIGTAGENGTGTILSETLESSTTDTGTEFTKMIVAQQAYSAASQVVSTSKSMFEDLVSAVR